MRLLLTVVAAGRGRAGAGGGPAVVRDLVLDLAEDATVADLAAALAPGVTADPTAGAVAAGPLFLGAEALDPAQPVRASAVRSGAVLGLGAAVPAVLAPPDGVVDVLVTSGPGAGRVHRQAAGTATVASAPGCTVVVDDPALAPVAVHLHVAPDGGVVVEPVGPPAPHRPAAGPCPARWCCGRRREARRPRAAGTARARPRPRRPWTPTRTSPSSTWVAVP